MTTLPGTSFERNVNERRMTAPPKVSRLGLIAGSGRLPFLVADGVRKRGGEVCAIGLHGICDPSLQRECSDFRWVGLIRLGQWIRTFKKWNIDRVVMVGGVSHTRKYARYQMFRHVPDWRAALLWYRHLRYDRRTATMLTVLAEELGRNGVTLIDSRSYITDHLANAGQMTNTTPSAALERDIRFGWEILNQSVEIGIGQCIAVRNCDVVAVEAAEGTNKMIARAGELCGGRPWVFLKTSAKDHDMRADVPTIGTETIRRMHAAGAAAMVLGANRVIMVDKPDVIEEADRLGIPIIGVEGQPFEAH